MGYYDFVAKLINYFNIKRYSVNFSLCFSENHLRRRCFDGIRGETTREPQALRPRLSPTNKLMTKFSLIANDPVAGLGESIFLPAFLGMETAASVEAMST